MGYPMAQTYLHHSAVVKLQRPNRFFANRSWHTSANRWRGSEWRFPTLLNRLACELGTAASRHEHRFPSSRLSAGLGSERRPLLEGAAMGERRRFRTLVEVGCR